MVRHVQGATAEDESWLYTFPDDTDVALQTVLAGSQLLTRNGWRLRVCAAPPTSGYRLKDYRVIVLELERPGGRELRLRLHAVNYVDREAIAGDTTEKRYPDIVTRLANTVGDAATTYTAGGNQWLDL